MTNISQYLPIDRRLALDKGKSLPSQAHGAALFADVSGFTPLTAAYANALGARQGAEELIRQINAVYTALINEIHQFGGSVIYFGGDSITCWFNEDNGQRAATCALAMQQSMAAFTAIATPIQKTVSLSIKVAIAVGSVRRFDLGDPSISKIDAIVGSTLNCMATAEKLANAREIVVSQEVVQQEPDNFVIAEWRHNAATNQRFAVISDLVHPAEPAPWSTQEIERELDEETVRPWFLPQVFNRLRRGVDQFLSELRPVVAMFLKFDGLDYDHDENVGEKLDAFIRWVQQVVMRYEGHLLQLNTGDKGNYLYISFGAPISHEDDADRALMAAQALRDMPVMFSFIQSFQFGISRGQMRVGPYGSQKRRVYGAFGHETNMAARLMSYAAPGEVVVSEHVVAAIVRQGNFALLALGPLSLKGSEHPLTAYTLADQRQTAVPPHNGHGQFIRQDQPLLVGREKEQALLAQKLAALQAGKSGIIILEGEAGIGKSSIVQNLLLEAQNANIMTLLGEADAIEHASPYFAWRAIFHHLLHLDAMPETQTRQAHVLQQLPPDDNLHQLAPLLNAVISLDLPENSLTQAMSGLSRATKTHELLVAILQQAATEQPLLIVLEDAHWLDSASWALTEVVSQQVNPLFLVLVSRPLDTDATAVLSPTANKKERSELADSPMLFSNPRITLKPLTNDDSLRLVCQRLGVDSLPRPIAAFITERAEGHPFFSEELAYSLREANIIRTDNGICHLNVDAAEVSKLDFPTTIEGVVTNRIDRLTPTQQLVLKVSSVIGRIFALTILYDIHPAQNERPFLNKHLQDLNRLAITQLERPEPELTYMFKHIITQQVSYNLLLYSQRRDLHLKVAEWFETIQANSLEEIYPLLAYHWYHALELTNLDPGQAKKAIFYAEQAGDQAIHNYANQEAIRFFANAQKIADQLNDTSIVPQHRRAHWELQMGEAYTGLGQLTEGLHHYEQCLELLGWPLAKTNGRIIFSTLQSLIWRKLPKRTKTTTPQQRTALREAARAYEMTGQIYYLTNQTLPTLYAMIRGLNLAETIGEGTPELARAYANMSGAVALVPMPKKSHSFEARAWATVRELDNMTALAYVSFIISVPKINTADWQEVEDGFQQGLTLATQLGDNRTAGFCISGLAHMTYYQGYFRRSLALFKQLEALGEAAQDVTHWGTALGAIGAVLMRWGQWSEAMAYFEKGLPLTQAAGNSLAEWNTHVRIGLAQFHLNQLDQAQKSVEAAYAYARHAPHSSFANTTIYADLLTLLLNLQEQTPTTVPDAPGKIKKLLKRYKQYARIFPFALPTYWRLRGKADWLNGHSPVAFKHWHKALSEAQRLDIPYEEGMAHSEIGRRLPNNDARRMAHLNQAIAIFSELEATVDRETAEVALAADPNLTQPSQ